MLIFLAGASDRVFVAFGISYSAQIWFFRVASLVLPFVLALVAHRVCAELQAAERVEDRRRQAIAAARREAALQAGGEGADDRAVGQVQ